MNIWKELELSKIDQDNKRTLFKVIFGLNDEYVEYDLESPKLANKIQKWIYSTGETGIVLSSNKVRVEIERRRIIINGSREDGEFATFTAEADLNGNLEDVDNN
jgi:hypothetical protein